MAAQRREPRLSRRRCGDPGRPIDYRQLGAIIARLHAVAPAELRALPFFGDAAWLAVDRRLAALLPWADRYGGDAAAYPDFARGYGADLRGSPIAEELATLRLLATTLNTLADPRFEAEAHARLRYWSGDPAAPVWNAL